MGVIAVLLIDMQDHFLRGVADDVNVLVANQIKVLQACREHDIPVAVLEYQGCGPTVHLLRQEIEKLPRYNAKTFLKLQDDGFGNPGLAPWLKERGVEHLVVMGVNTCGCVKSTAVSGQLYDFRIMTSSILISCCHYVEDRDAECHYFFFRGMDYGLDELLRRISCQHDCTKKARVLSFIKNFWFGGRGWKTLFR